LKLTARAFYRVLKLNRTIFDMAGSEGNTHEHLTEELPYPLKMGLI
jgi:predicted ATPase with chaperone activity